MSCLFKGQDSPKAHYRSEMRASVGTGRFLGNSSQSEAIDRPGISAPTLNLAGIHRSNQPEPGSIAIPYRDMTGSLTGFTRWRLPKERANGQKYHQEKGSGVHVYFTPDFYRLGPGSDLVVVEGEFKALALYEAGAKAIGLPSFNTYTNGSNSQKEILPGITETINFVRPDRVLFLGDSDTALNAAFSRNAVFLAQAVHPTPVVLPRLPLDGPKGVDDVKQERGGGFRYYWEDVSPKQRMLTQR